MSHESYRIQFQGGPLDGCILESISGDNPPISSLSITCDPVDNQERFVYYEPDEGYEDRLKEQQIYIMSMTQDDYDDEMPDECGVEDTEDEEDADLEELLDRVENEDEDE